MVGPNVNLTRIVLMDNKATSDGSFKWTVSDVFYLAEFLRITPAILPVHVKRRTQRVTFKRLVFL
jgi:hypothetical protein